jgi:hypothetical protein
MDYRESKRLFLGDQQKITFSVPSDLDFEGIEIVSRDLKFAKGDFTAIDVDVSKVIRGPVDFLEISIKNYPVELKGIEIEISVFGSFKGMYIDMDEFAEYSDDFINKWA